MQLVGFLDRCEDRLITGWVLDRDDPGRRLAIEVFAGADRLGGCVADRFRKDLAQAGHGDGAYAFVFVPPPTLDASALGTLTIRVDGTGWMFRPARGPLVREPVAAPAGDTFAHVDALDLPPIDAATLRAGTRLGVFVEPPGTPRPYDRPPPAFHDDPDGAGLFSRQAEPLPFASAPAFVAAVPNARVVGYRTILTPDGRLLDDQCRHTPALRDRYLEELAKAEPFPNEDTGLQRHGESDRFRLERDGSDVTELPGCVAVLCSTEPSNYGSFLFRILPKLATLRAVGIAAPVLVWAPQPTYREHLALAGIPEDRLIQHDTNRTWRIGRAIVPSQRNPDGWLDDTTRAFFAGLRDRHGDRAGEAERRRIYVSRRGYTSAGRRMINEAALEQRLEAIGFTIVRPHAMSALEQIRAFAGADMVVGPSGAAMFNAVFCRPGTRLIDIESEPHWLHAHACLFASSWLNWGVFEGKTLDRDFSVAHKPFTVNIEALLDRIADFAGR